MGPAPVLHAHDVPYCPSACEILLQARRRFSQLEGWLLSADAMTQPLHQIEREEERQGREVQRLLLQAHVLARWRGDVGPALRLFLQEPGQAEAILRRRGEKVRHLKTIFGKIEVPRVRYLAPGHFSLHPMDEVLAMPSRSFSYEVQRRLVQAVVQGPFREALSRVKESTGVSIPKGTALQIVQEAAVDFDSFYQQRATPDAKTTGPIVVGSVDGKGIPLVKRELAKKVVRRGKGQKAQKKRMATVAAVFTQSVRVRTPEEVVQSLFEPELKLVGQEIRPPRHRPENKRVWASLLSGKDAVITEVAHEMKRRDPEGTKTHVVVTDGERALQTRATKIIPQVTGRPLLVVLDLVHVLEYLWKASYVYHKEGTAEAAEWVRERALRILQGKVSQVVKGMRQSATKQGLRGAKRKVIDNVSGYFYRNRRRMRYDEYLSKGLSIASGAVEGACKNLVKDRMERSGMRWTETGAEAMVKLRAIDRSGDFDDYWAFHVDKEQARLRGKTRWTSITPLHQE